MLLSTRLVRMIEDHAEGLTRGIVEILRTSAKTASYQRLPEADVHRRAYGVYRNLGKWLTAMSDDEIEESYRSLAFSRYEEQIPLSEVIYALTFTKYHLRDYISASGIVNTAVALAQEQELQFLIGRFFDKAIYYTARGYEEAMRQEALTGTAARRT